MCSDIDILNAICGGPGPISPPAAESKIISLWERMPNMRKEVKLGFAIGGVILTVLIIWALSVGGSNEPKVDQIAAAPRSGNAVVGGNQANPSQPSVTLEPVTPALAQTAARQATVPQGGAIAQNQNQAQAQGDADWGKLLNGDLLMNQSAHAAAPAQVPAAIDPPAVIGSQQTAETQVTPPQNEQVAVAAPAATPAQVVPSGPRTHRVQDGETLSSIAVAAYGSASYYPHILRANPNLDPKKLKIGMTITLPDISSVKPPDVPGGAAAQHASATEQKVDQSKEYKVQPGDSLYKISVKLYGKSEMQTKIYELNKEQIGADPAKLKLGAVLKLPSPPTVAAGN